MSASVNATAHADKAMHRITGRLVLAEWEIEVIREEIRAELKTVSKFPL